MKQDLEITSKAWKVIDPTIWENPLEADGEIVYAESAAKAKTLCQDYGEFVDIRATRCPDADYVIYEGKELRRWKVESKLKYAEKIAKQSAELEQYGEQEGFYIQNGYVGNSVLWWAQNGRGYTTDITKAHKYTKEDIKKHFLGGRPEDRIWAASHVEQHIKVHVDGQYLESKYCIR